MILDQLFPAKTPTMTEGTLVAWKVKKGDAVKVGQVVAELQTDKAVMEWEAGDAGTGDGPIDAEVTSLDGERATAMAPSACATAAASATPRASASPLVSASTARNSRH